MSGNPQVLHIGFSKCASTYLRALFRAHPGIHLVFKSGFFTPFLAEDMTFEEYQKLFRQDHDILNVESDEHLILPGIHPVLGVRATSLGEFALVADRIRSFLPDVRIVMVIRNQPSLIVSRYSEFLIAGGSLSFEEFADELLGKGAGQNLWYQNYYRQLIGILEDRFPRANLLILLQEAMRGDTRRTAADISRFLGLRDDLQLQEGLRSERRSLSLAGMTLLAWMNKLTVTRPSFGGAPPTTRIPLSMFQNLVRAVRALDYYVLAHISPSSSKVLTADRAREILDYFRKDNLALQDYFGLDLAPLGYLAEEAQSLDNR